MTSSWHTLIELNSPDARLRVTTTGDADPLTMAVGYILDHIGYFPTSVPPDLIVENHGHRVVAKYHDITVEVRTIQHWPELDFSQIADLADKVREKYPARRQTIQAA